MSIKRLAEHGMLIDDTQQKREHAILRYCEYEDVLTLSDGIMSPEEVKTMREKAESTLDPLEMAKVAVALKENAVLKKALEMAISETGNALREMERHGIIKIKLNKSDEDQINYYIQQAKEALSNG